MKERMQLFVIALSMLLLQAHWGLEMVHCDSDNGSLPVWHQAITWISVDLLSVGYLEKELSELKCNYFH